MDDDDACCREANIYLELVSQPKRTVVSRLYMAVSENPYRRRPQWNDLRWLPLSQSRLSALDSLYFSFYNGSGIQILLVVNLLNVFFLKFDTNTRPPRWTIIQQHDVMKKSGAASSCFGT